jgi:hypothetical protein
MMQYRFTCAQHNVVLGGCPEFYPAAEDAAGVAEWVIDLSDMSCPADDASDNGSGCAATWQITAAGVSLAAFTPAEIGGLSDALATAENVDEHLTRDQLAAAAKLDAAFAAAPQPPADRYPAPDPAAADWIPAYPPLSDETACLVMQEILVDTEFLYLTAVDPPSGERGEVTLVDAVTTFAGNCWDDQHDGGAHRQNLIDANRLLIWLGRPDLTDDYNDVQSLIGDDVPEPERWASRP